MSKSKTSTKKKSSSKKPSEKTSAKQALANVEANIARIEAAENGTLAPEAEAAAEAVPVGAVAPKPKKGKGGKAKTAADTKPAKPKKEKPAKVRKLSLMDHAIAVLRKHGKPMSTKEITDEVLKAGEWKTSGKTPSATLYSAIIREIVVKKNQSRFVKAERGKFELAKGA